MWKVRMVRSLADRTFQLRLDPELMKPGSAEEASHAVLFSDFSPGGAVDLLNSPASGREEGHADRRVLFEGPFLQIVRSEKT